MRRMIAILTVALIIPVLPVSATETPFNFYIEDEVVIHPDETIQFKIAWHNIVGFERHFAIQLNNSHSNLSIEDIPSDWTRVGSGRLGETTINVSVLPNSNFETISFSLDITCQEVPEWKYTHPVDVLVSRWSNLMFGANDGSSFFVQQSVNTSFSVNISNNAGYDDLVTIDFDTDSDWNYGFVGDINNDKKVLLDLQDGEDIFISFWIVTPPILDGSPLAGEGPTFKLQAQSGLDRRFANWTFSLEMETYHNMTIDFVDENLSLEPGDDKLLEVTVRNNGNTATFLDASLKFGSILEDRIEYEGWTVAIFNAFEFDALEPNESRTIDIGFDSPNLNAGEFEVVLIVKPQSFDSRARSVFISSSIDWKRDGIISSVDDNCASVQWNQTCQKMITVENAGNFLEEYSLSIVDKQGMDFEITQEPFTLAKGETSAPIPINLTTLSDAEGLDPASATVLLQLSSGEIIDTIQIQSLTAPRVNWVWDSSADSVNNGRLEIVVTLRNDGNIADGLIVKMTSSYYTEMSFVPPNNAIVEDNSEYIRSFEMINIEKGSNFTFRAWAEIPDDQNSNDDFFLNITANSRLDENNPFYLSVNTTFDAAQATGEEDNSVVGGIVDVASSFFAIMWAWKWIIMATLISGLMINKSLRDRMARMADANLLNQQNSRDEQPEDWMAEFANKKQSVPEIAESPQIPSEVFTGMFQAVGGERKPTAAPVDSRLVGAASTVLDHHDSIAVKNKLDLLVSDIAEGDVSRPHVANTNLPDNVNPVTERTVPIVKREENIPEMLDLDDLDL